MHDPQRSRRDFLQVSGTVLGGAWLALHLPAIEAAAAHARRTAGGGLGAVSVLTPEEARELDAIAAQIIPTDDLPGAREAGVVPFMDRAFETFAAGMLASVRAGLQELRATVRDRFPGVERFSDLDGPRQVEVLMGIEDTPFFGAVRFLTVAGMFADPSYGGNRDRVGWTLLGFDGHFVHQPPFGYYDAAYAREARDGGR
jgi:gluconate 2-dehydrogenase gamma chain